VKARVWKEEEEEESPQNGRRVNQLVRRSGEVMMSNT
jgi:hypothetical protein